MTDIDVSYSTLRNVASCDTRTALANILRLTKPRDEEDAALLAGTAAHEALAAFLGGSPTPFAVATFVAKYQQAADALNPGLYPWQQRLTMTNTRAIMERWFETHPVERLPFRVRPDLIEVGFKLPLVDGVNLHGIIDVIVEYQGDLYVVDHKTTGRIDSTWRHSFRLDAQMSAYVWAASETLGTRVRGIFINGIEFCKLPTSDKKCKEHNLLYSECGPEHATFEMPQVDRSDVELQAWLKDTTVLAQRYRHLVQTVTSIDDVTEVLQQGTYNGSCRFCSFKDFCENERRAPGLLVPREDISPLARK